MPPDYEQTHRDFGLYSICHGTLKYQFCCSRQAEPKYRPLRVWRVRKMSRTLGKHMLLLTAPTNGQTDGWTLPNKWSQLDVTNFHY